MVDDDKKVLSYRSSLEHILDELSCLDLMLKAQVIQMQKRAAKAGKFEKVGQFVITDAEVNSLVGTQKDYGTPPRNQESDNKNVDKEILDITQAISYKKAQISQRVAESAKGGVYLSLPHLAALFHLGGLEVDLIVICLALEVDIQVRRKYERIYAYLNDNLMQKKPTIDLVLSLVYNKMEDRISAKRILSQNSNLFKYRLLEIIENDQNYDSASDRVLKLDARIANFLLGLDNLDARISSFAKFIDTKKVGHSLSHDATLLENVKRVMEGMAYVGTDMNKPEGSKRVIIGLLGPKGSLKKEVAANICSTYNRPLLAVDLEDVISRGLQIEDSLILAFREAAMYGAAVYLDNFEWLFTQATIKREESSEMNHKERQPNSLARSAARIINEISWLTFISSTSNDVAATVLQQHEGILQDSFFAEIEFKIPSFEERKKIWNLMLEFEQKKKETEIDKNIDTAELAGKFPFTYAKIHDSILFARNLALTRSSHGVKQDGKGKKTMTMQDIQMGCNSQSSRILSGMARRIETRYTWDDIILPPKITALLRDIGSAVKYKHKVYYEWGFGKKFSLGKGLTALFTGESGTGKTMAAEVLAKELSLDLYKIDVSSILSKYIGETEKNLSTIFQESEGSNALLFFDESDSLFGKRTEVRDSHDRYANIETNFLLQKVDEYEGTVVLSSNYRKNIDDAFIRRMQFIVDFPFPNTDYRLKIWKKSFPKETPMDDKIDFEFLASNFQISGGNIKNIATNSAFIAAANSNVVSMKDILIAAKREFDKMGKPLRKSDFGRYSPIIEEE